MPQDTLTLFLAIFAATVLAFMAVWVLVTAMLARRRGEMQRRIGADDTDTLVASTPDTGSVSRFDIGFNNMIARTGLEMDPALALGVILFCGVILSAAVFVWRMEEEAWLAIPAFFFGAAIPLAYFVWKQQAYRRLLQNQLPDAFYLLARSMRAGRSLDQSFALVGEQGVTPMAYIFGRMHKQLELGLSLGQVLQGTARRLGLVDFNVFASVVGLHRTTGGNLPIVLDRLASSTRDRNQFERQYQAATVLGRYSAAFIAAMAGVILFYFFFFQRDWAMRYFESSIGITLFVTAMSLEVLGLLLLYWLLKHDY